MPFPSRTMLGFVAALVALVAQCGCQSGSGGSGGGVGLDPPDRSPLAGEGVRGGRAADLQSVGKELPVGHSDAGLEVVVFGTTAGSPEIARALAPYSDHPVPAARTVESLWAEHGLRMVSVPVGEVSSIIEAMQDAGLGLGARERQWLGQAYAWTEAVRGPQIARPTTVALDAERITLQAGALRLLVRGWLEPLPPPVGLPVGVMGSTNAEPGGDPVSGSERLPMAALRVEIVPQHLESSARSVVDPLEPPTSSRLDAMTQGLVFTRLYVQAQMQPGRALLILAERPGVSWRELAVQPAPPRPEAVAASESAASSTSSWPRPADRARREESQSERPWSGARAGAEASPLAEAGERSTAGRSAIGVGEVVRERRDSSGTPSRDGQPTRADAAQVPPQVSGPSAPRVPTLGEAMLTTARRVVDDRSPKVQERAVIVLIPHVPEAFRLSP